VRSQQVNNLDTEGDWGRLLAAFAGRAAAA